MGTLTPEQWLAKYNSGRLPSVLAEELLEDSSAHPFTNICSTAIYYTLL